MRDPQNGLSGIEICRDKAIQNLGGKEWIYNKYVSIFINRYSGSAVQLKQLIKDGETEEARMLIHSVKGLAGTLGFSDLYSSACLLETAIICSSPRLQELLILYETHIRNAAGRQNE